MVSVGLSLCTLNSSPSKDSFRLGIELSANLGRSLSFSVFEGYRLKLIEMEGALELSVSSLSSCLVSAIEVCCLISGLKRAVSLSLSWLSLSCLPVNLTSGVAKLDF